MSLQATEKRKETLASMCDERARIVQDQFNVSMNHIQAMSILISTFHHAKSPSAIDQVLIFIICNFFFCANPLIKIVLGKVRMLVLLINSTLAEQD